jgi:O-antigen/teichoic acid export membrane protein
MHINAIRSIITSVLGTLGVLLFVNQSGDIIIAAWIISGAFALNTIWMLIYYSKKYFKLRLELDLSFVKDLLKAAIPLGIAFFIINLYNSLDAQMLEFMFEDKNRSNYYNGVYGAAHQVVLAAMIPSGILQGAFFPQFSQKYSLKDEFNHLMLKYSTMTFLIGVFGALLLFLFANNIVDLLLDVEYSETGNVLQYLAITIFIIYLNVTYFSPLIAAGLEKQVLWANAAGLLFNAVMNFVLIPEYNVYGAAWATIGSEIGVLLILIFLFKRRFGKLYSFNLLKMFFISLLSITPYLTSFIFEINFLILLIVCILIFIILNFAFGTISIKELKGLLKK